MKLLDQIRAHSINVPARTAIADYHGQSFTYAQLEQYSDRIAGYLQERIPNDKSPIVVYGDKNPYMLVIFLACVKVAHPYCPLDTSVPQERALDVLESIEPHIVFATEPFQHEHWDFVPLEEIVRICSCEKSKNNVVCTLEDKDVFYILFTSGSTGKPKGVEITARCIDRFLQWSETLVQLYQGEDFIFLNQSPFSFDLSVMDIYTSLYMGGTLRIIDDGIQANFKRMLQALGQSDAVVWVSTPSLVDMCLMSKKFSRDLLPHLKLFFFCGEILTNATARQLIERFPDADIINAYGPTETTVAVTAQIITKEMADSERALPVGKSKPNCSIEIWKEDGSLADRDEMGEIVIKGDTVGNGYFKQPRLTEKAFVPYLQDGVQQYAYKTGDRGYLDESGILYFGGRFDMQVQLHGYRIELSDVERNLLKLEMISSAVVLPQLDSDNRLRRLVACVVVDSDVMEKHDEQEVRWMMKEALGKQIPKYMIPSKIFFLNELPRNQNGKMDRKKLQTLIE